MKAINIFILCIMGLSLINVQDSNTPRKLLSAYNATDKHFIEGTYNQNVGAAYDIELISLYKWFPKKLNFNTNEKYYFSFFAPKVDSFLLQVEEKNPKAFYWLESKRGLLTNQGINNLGPWTHKNVKTYYSRDGNVGSKKMAILLKIAPKLTISPDNNYRILPLSVFEHNQLKGIHSDMPFQYKAFFRFKKTFLKGDYSVFKGELDEAAIPNSESTIIDKSNLSHSSSSFWMSVQCDSLKDYEGWLTVRVRVKFTDNSTDKNQFYFYHHAAP